MKSVNVVISDICYRVCFILCSRCLSPGVGFTFRLVVMSSFIVKASVASSRLILIRVCAEIWWNVAFLLHVTLLSSYNSGGRQGSSRPKDWSYLSRSGVCVSGTKTSLQGWCDTGSWDGMRRTTTVPCRLNLQIPQIPTQHLLIIGQ